MNQGGTYTIIVSQKDIKKYLKSLRYPATKEDLIEAAWDEGAGDDVLYTLAEIPKDEFMNSYDLSRGIRQIAM